MADPMAAAVRDIEVKVVVGPALQRLAEALAAYGVVRGRECAAEEAELFAAAQELLTEVHAGADAEADLELRLGVALHQRDVWRQAHTELAAAVGPNGDLAQQQIEHWRVRYNDLASVVGAMHGGDRR